MLIANLQKKSDAIDDVLESCTTNKHEIRQTDDAIFDASMASLWSEGHRLS